VSDLLKNPEIVGLITSILGLVVGYVARHKGLTWPSNEPVPPTPAPAPPTVPPAFPQLPVNIPTEPLDLLRLGASLIRQRRQQRQAEEEAFAKIGDLFPDK